MLSVKIQVILGWSIFEIVLFEVHLLLDDGDEEGGDGGGGGAVGKVDKLN